MMAHVHDSIECFLGQIIYDIYVFEIKIFSAYYYKSVIYKLALTKSIFWCLKLLHYKISIDNIPI